MTPASDVVARAHGAYQRAVYSFNLHAVRGLVIRRRSRPAWRGLIACLLTLTGLAACGSGSDAPARHLVLGDHVYLARGFMNEDIPPDRLTLVGTTTDTDACGEDVDHADVFAVKAIDSSIVVSVVCHPSGKPLPMLFLGREYSSYPPEACALFDSDAVGAHGPLAPEECRTR